MAVADEQPPPPRLAAALDAVSGLLGRAVAWLTVVMVGLGIWNTLARWGGRSAGIDLASNGLIEAQWYAFSALFLFGASSTLRDDGHVRVDVFYARTSERTRAWIDLVGTVVLALPFCVTFAVLAWPGAVESFELREISPDPGGLPRWPIRGLVPVGFALVALQAVSEAIKRLALLRSRRHGSRTP